VFCDFLMVIVMVCAVSRPASIWLVLMAGIIRYYRIGFLRFAEFCEKVQAGGLEMLCSVDPATTVSWENN
jgi:hypothetical protein